MAKQGGNRNFGYGKQMAWAGKQALLDRYGDGHYATVAAHAGRWKQFANWAKSETGVRDAQMIDAEMVQVYGQALAEKVHDEEMSTAYAQNLLSTVNVVLEALRGDRAIRVSPAKMVGQRHNMRAVAPSRLSHAAMRSLTDDLKENGHHHAAAVIEIARYLGLRKREASLLNARAALSQATTLGKVNITEGTKGGRGKHVDRWVPVSVQGFEALRNAATAQGIQHNLIPANQSWSQWNNQLRQTWLSVRDAYGVKKIHDLRADFACNRYADITGTNAPVIQGQRTASKTIDEQARQIIALELGHGRIDVVAAYIGGAR